ncbi:hypothetical protein EGM97_17795 [Pseudomonas sp. AF32]|nr:hypothetical protein [Pseudomonas sp. AF32]
MGASLLAMTVCQSTMKLADRVSSRAGSLPQGIMSLAGRREFKTRKPCEVPHPRPRIFNTNAYSSATSRNPW